MTPADRPPLPDRVNARIDALADADHPPAPRGIAMTKALVASFAEDGMVLTGLTTEDGRTSMVFEPIDRDQN